MREKGEHVVRKATFERNPDLERLLEELNVLLAPVQDGVARRFTKPKRPLLLVVGSPRSGTTLMLQWLASLGHFAYPTNLLSRFYDAPYIGALIQRMLTDPQYSFRDEFYELQDLAFNFESALGKTVGLLAPHEFWYFWRRFFAYGDHHFLDERALARIDKERFAAELASLEAAFAAPLALKAMIVNCNIRFVASVLDTAIFVYVRRRPFYNIQSLLKARREYSGSLDEWYSFRPREYPELRRLDPVRQVAGQVYHLNRTIEEGLATLPEAKRLVVDYEQFCVAPDRTYRALVEKCALLGETLPEVYAGCAGFDLRDHVKMDDGEAREIGRAYAEFSGEEALP